MRYPIGWIHVHVYTCNNSHFEVKMSAFKIIDGMGEYLKEYNNIRKRLIIWAGIDFYAECHLLPIAIV